MLRSEAGHDGWEHTDGGVIRPSIREALGVQIDVAR